MKVIKRDGESHSQMLAKHDRVGQRLADDKQKRVLPTRAKLRDKVSSACSLRHALFQKGLRSFPFVASNEKRRHTCHTCHTSVQITALLTLFSSCQLFIAACAMMHKRVRGAKPERPCSSYSTLLCGRPDKSILSWARTEVKALCAIEFRDQL